MALFSLADEWTIELDAEFERRVEDGSMVFVHGDHAVWIDLFEDSCSISQKMKMLREDVPQNARSWKFDQNSLTKFGYLERDEENENFELTTFSVALSGYALMTFYFDDVNSLDWALDCWKSVQFETDD